MQDSVRGNSHSLFEGVARVHHLFEKVVKTWPERTALIWKNQELTYRDLSELADKAAGLFSARPEDETIVAVSARASFEMVAAVLGAMKAGKAFLPLDPETPVERLKEMIRVSGVKSFLGSEDKILFTGLGLQDAEANQRQIPPAETTGNIPAYVMFTSGSAGNSKAVPVSHFSFLNYLRNAIELYSDPEDHSLSGFFHLNLTFDASLTALFVALSTGKKLVIASREYRNRFEDPVFRKYAPYDFIKITPYQLFEMEEAGDDSIFHLTGKYVIGGEDLLYSELDVLRKRNVNARIFNEYGPTETCVGCMVKTVNLPLTTMPSGHAISLGRPMKGVDVLLLGEDGNPAEQGKPGEICISGIQLSEGYIGKPCLTGLCFMDIDTGTGRCRIYRTGDLAVQGAEGEFYFLCRKERLGSVRAGMHTAAGIEASIATLQGVKHVYARLKYVSGKVFTVAYITLENNFSGQIALKQKLRKMSMECKLSLLVILLDRFPLTPHKKMNRRALPDVGSVLDSIVSQKNNPAGICRDQTRAPLFFLHTHMTVAQTSGRESEVSKRIKRILAVRGINGFMLLSDQAGKVFEQGADVSRKETMYLQV